MQRVGNLLDGHRGDVDLEAARREVQHGVLGDNDDIIADAVVGGGDVIDTLAPAEIRDCLCHSLFVFANVQISFHPLGLNFVNKGYTYQ